MIIKIILFPLRLFLERFSLPIYKKRKAKYIASLCDNNSRILDVGCDDGSTAEIIMKLNPSLKIVGIDVQSHRPSKIPKVIYDGKRIPFPDDSFDIVMVLDVLHHAEDIPLLLKEINRVSKKYIIIKDHIAYSVFSRFLLAFNDYIANAPRGIESVFNYPSLPRWDSYFNELNLKMVQGPQNLKFGFGINERYNPIFKLEKGK